MVGRFFVELDDRGVFDVSGPDRLEFLQGLITNDVAKLAPNHALYAAFLTAQGRYLHDFFLSEIGESFFIEVENSRQADLMRRLGMFKLRAKVTLTSANERFGVAVAFGSDALTALGLPENPGAATGFAGGIAYVDPRLSALGARLLLPRENGSVPLEIAGFARSDIADYDRRRLALGVADGSRDLTIEKALLLESGFDELNGIDWNKGCYIGQELTARTKYRGLVKKRLLPVEVTGPLPPAGTKVMLGDDEVGELRSGRDELALALLRLDAIEKATEERPLLAGEARLKTKKPSWANF